MAALGRPFSYSQLSAYLRCQKAHDYGYRQGLKSNRPTVALRTGSLVDIGLEAALKEREAGDKGCSFYSATAINRAHDDWCDDFATRAVLDASPEFADKMSALRSDSIEIANRAIRVLELDTDRFETLKDIDGKLGVQYEVRHALISHKPGYIGFVDWVARDNQTGFTGPIDFKVRKTLEGNDAIAMDYQLSSYEYAMSDKFAEPFTGVALYQMKSSVPKAPRILKSGKLSVAGNQACDYDTYAATVTALGLNLSDYSAMRDKLPEFDRWTWTRRSSEELLNTWAQIEDGAAELVRFLSGDRPGLRVLNPKTCSWCDYKELCIAELKGHDSDYIRSDGFVDKYEINSRQQTKNQP